MEKFDDLLNKFQDIKNNLDQKDIHFLCAHSFKSVLYGIKGIYKDLPSTPNQKNLYSSKKQASNIKSPNNFSNIDKDSLKNLVKTLENSKNNINNKGKNDDDKSPSVYNDDEKNNNDNTISLKEEDEEKICTNNTKESSKEKLKSPVKKVIKNQENISSISAFDKNNNDANFNIYLKDSLIKINNFLIELSKKIPKISLVEGYFAQNKNSLESSYNITSNNNSIEIKAIKSFIHLLFNTLSKIFNTFTKETENICYMSSQNLIILISIIIDIVVQIKKFLTKNKVDIDLNFLKEIKLVGKYCKLVLIIKRDDFEQMKIIKEKKDNEKINKFFQNYLTYFKCVKKLRNIIKDSEFLNKFFNMQPTMISYIDLFEINRRLINFHLNVNYKK